MTRKIIKISNYKKNSDCLKENVNDFIKTPNIGNVKDNFKNEFEKEYKDLIKEYDNLEDFYKNS